MTSLELSPADFRSMVDQVAERLARFIETLPDQPAWNVDLAEEVARSVIQPLPERGRQLDIVLEELFERLVPVGYNTASPGYLAYIPGGGLPESGVADWIAGVTNRFASVWVAGPAMAQIESVAVRWFCDIVGYGPESGGFLTTGGSLANWSGLVTARRTLLPDDFLNATIYTSAQAHHSVCKAAIMAGFPQQNVRFVATNADYQVSCPQLEAQLEQDRSSGLRPFAIVGHAGTTNTGAVDDLDRLADLATQHDLWLHVDAAYGGFFMMTARGKRLLRGLDRADSITLDPHKGLFLPYGTGGLLVRDFDHLERAHRVDGDYMPPMQAEREFVDFCNVSPELSRDWRGLRVWLPLQLHGVRAFREALGEKLDLAAWAAEQLRRIDCGTDLRLELVSDPQLSIVAFRLISKGLTQEDTNELNRRFLRLINSPRRVFLTGTTLEGRFVLRICVLSFRTHIEQMRECIKLIERAVAELRGKRSSQTAADH